MYQVVNNLSHQAGAHALPGRRRFPLQRRHASPIRGRSAAPTRSRRSRTSWPASTTTPASRRRSAPREVSQTQPEPRRLRAGRVEGRPWRHAERRAALRPAVPRDDQHRHQQRLAARRARVVAVRVAPHGRARQRGPLLRSRAAARRSPTRCCRPATRPTWPTCGRSSVSLSPTQAGAPAFPHILQRRRPVGHAAQPDDDGPAPAERVLAAGERRDRAAARRREPRSASATSTCAANICSCPSTRTCRRASAVGHQQRLPARTRPTRTTASTPPPASSTYHGLHVSFVQRPARWGSYRVSLHAVEVDEQRRRVLLQLADRSVRPVEGLGPLRRRPAASAGRSRRHPHADGAGATTRGSASATASR